MIDEFITDLTNIYSHEKLIYLYKNYLSKIEIAIPKHFSFYKEVRNIKTNKYDRKYLTELLRITYSDKELFNKFLNLFDEDIQKIFKIVVSVTEINQSDLSVKIGQRVNFSPTSKNRFEILSYLFQVKGYSDLYSFSLPDSISQKLIAHTGNKSSYKFPDRTIEKGLLIHEDKDDMLGKIKSYYNFINEKDKIDVSSITNFKKDFEIKEFYQTKDRSLAYIKTKIIFNFLMNIDYIYNPDSLYIIKQLFKNYKDYKTKFFTYTLIDHLTFPKQFLDSNKDKVKNNYFQIAMIDVLFNLPLDQWVSFNDITGLMEANHLYNKLISDDYADFSHFKNNLEIIQYLRNPRIYNEALTIPAIKASMFLFSSFGLLDIAYTQPQNNLKLSGKDYLSIYDGLKYVKLTSLGDYVLGKSEIYVTQNQTNEKITLDHKRLMIKLSTKNGFKSKTIKIFADEIDGLNYKVTFKSFLNDCSSKNDISEKIKNFKSKISDENIPVWEDFFKDLLSKAQMINQKNDFSIYKLEKNKDLLELFSKDDFLRQNTIKAENFKILIENVKVKAVSERLKEFGYFI